MKKIMDYFTRKIIIQLGEDEIFFDILKLNKGEKENTLTYKLHDISSYQIQFPNNKFACTALKLKSGGRKEFSFRRGMFNDEQSSAVLIIETIHKTFEQHEIEFVPSFYGSQKGVYTIIFLVTLLFIFFGIAIYLHKNLTANVVGSMLLIGQIVSRRMSDLAFYKKWKKA